MLKHRRPAGRVRPAANTKAPKSEYFSYHSSRLATEGAVGRRNNPGNKRPWYYALRNLPSILAMIAIVISFGYTMTLDTNPKVVTLSMRSDVKLLRDQETYRKVAEDILQDSIFSRTKITINGSGFEKAMRQQFPELEQVSITLPLVGHRPIIQLAARKPILSFTGQQGVFLLDSAGLAMIKASDAGGKDSLNLTSVIDESGLPLELGKGVLTSQEVAFISVLVAQINAGKQVITSIALPAIVNELHIRFKDQPAFVKFDMQNDPRTSAGAYLAIKQRLDNDHITPVEYIDMRLEDRAFYK